MRARAPRLSRMEVLGAALCFWTWAGWVPGPATAQTCGGEYTIKEGETLAQIAARVYGSPSEWTVIFYSNQDRLGANATLLMPEMSLRLPCIGGAPVPSLPIVSQAPTPTVTPTKSGEQPFLISSMVRRIDFLTADGYTPYTGRNLEGGGMLTQVLSSAMNLIKDEAKGRFDYGISWVNDWASHLTPLLSTRAFDIGFPWARPNCENLAELEQSALLRCQQFFFSEPLHEVVTVLFVRKESRIKTLRIEEIAGASICRPTGYPVQEFNQGGRNWLKDGKVTLMRPPTVDECFRLLERGVADAVAIAELVGRASIASLGLGDQVRTLDPPLALTTLHVVISKGHPHARTMLYYVNSALTKLRESGEYERIIERHLVRYWEAQAAPNAALATSPATVPKVIPGPAPKEFVPPAPATSPPLVAPTSTAKSEQPQQGAR